MLLIGLPIINALLWVMTLEKEMATYSSILAWRIPRTEKPGGLQSVGSQTVRHNWATNTHTHTHKHTHESWLKNLIKNIKMCVFYRQGNWGSETLVNLFKVKLSGREGLELKTQVFWIWELIFFLLQHSSCQTACHCEIVLMSFNMVIWFAKQPIVGLPRWL